MKGLIDLLYYTTVYCISINKIKIRVKMCPSLKRHWWRLCCSICTINQASYSDRTLLTNMTKRLYANVSTSELIHLQINTPYWWQMQNIIGVNHKCRPAVLWNKSCLLLYLTAFSRLRASDWHPKHSSLQLLSCLWRFSEPKMQTDSEIRWRRTNLI